MNIFKSKRNFFRIIKDKSLSLFLIILASCTTTSSNQNNNQSSVSSRRDEEYIRPFHHLPDGTFRNPEGSIEREDYDFPWIKFTKERMAIKVNIPKDHVIKKEEAISQLNALANEDTITWIGHATFLIKIGDKTIITDPFFSPNAGPVELGPRRYVDPGIPLSKLPKIDLVLTTHNHYDHLDSDTTKNFPFKKAKVVVPLKLGSFYKEFGFKDVTELDWHKNIYFDGVKITLLPAIHWSKRQLFDRNKTLWGSFLIEYRGRKLLFCCDTAMGEVYKRIGREYGPVDIAFINIGAYQPKDIMKYSHASPEEALEIGRNLRARKVIGTHWGTIVMSLEDPFEPPIKFKENARNFGYDEKDAVVFKIGETRSIKEI